MKTILHSFGLADDTRELAAALNFTHCIEPCDMFNPLADLRKLDAAGVYGLKLWLDVSRYVQSRGLARWDAAFAAWSKAVALHPAFAGAYVYGDPECELDAPGGYIASVQAIRAAGIRTAATFSHRVLNAQVGSLWLNYCDCEGIGAYTQWAGDGATPNAFTASSVISGFASALAATGRSNTTQKWLFLQGFVDDEWEATGQNKTPTKEEFQTLINLAPGWDVGYFGLSPWPEDISRIRSLALRPDIHDEVMWINAKLLGRPAVYPSRAITRLGQTTEFKCPIPNAQWSASGANDIEINQNGAVRAGAQSGRVTVTASLGAQTARGELFIYRED